MKVNLHVPKVEIVPVEVPDEMLTNIIFDNCKANWYYINEHYGYAFVDDFQYAAVETANGEEIPVLEY